ncbi:MAG: type II toxin-antitoxin system VapC family toxin [Cyanobacteria bacterium P01_H01_bin.152]
MNLLLDTHTLIWYLQEDEKLSSNMAKTLEDAGNSACVSIVSLWEIAIKLNLEKISLDIPFSDLPGLLEPLLIRILPVVFTDTENYLRLPLHHRDPFDRMIVAQAISHSLTIVSIDKALDAHPVQRLWA